MCLHWKANWIAGVPRGTEAGRGQPVRCRSAERHRTVKKKKKKKKLVGPAWRNGRVWKAKEMKSREEAGRDSIVAAEATLTRDQSISMPARRRRWPTRRPPFSSSFFGSSSLLSLRWKDKAPNGRSGWNRTRSHSRTVHWSHQAKRSELCLLMRWRATSLALLKKTSSSYYFAFPSHTHALITPLSLSLSFLLILSSVVCRFPAWDVRHGGN